MVDLLTISLTMYAFGHIMACNRKERQKGNDFVVNMQASFQPIAGIISSLDNTVDYATLFDIINTTMQKPVDLLETLVQNIAHAAHQKFRN
jgi:dihydroneopterin aldolase